MQSKRFYRNARASIGRVCKFNSFNTFWRFSRAGATYDDIEDAKIAVSEAVTNAVKHAYKRKNNVGIINIYFEILEDKIKIVISDKGDSFDYETTKSKIGPYDKDEI